MHTIHSVVRGGASAYTIHDFKSWGLSPALQKYFGSAAGGLSPTFATVMRADPIFRFSTTALKTALDNIAMSGDPIAAATPLGAYIAKRDDKGGLSASGHELLSMSNGFIVPRTLNLDHGTEPAAIDYEAILLEAAAGGSPITHTTGATLPTLVAMSEAYTIGPVYYGTTTLVPELTTVAIDFGLRVVLRPYHGKVWPEACYIAERMPKITVTTEDIATARLIGGATQIGSGAASQLKVFIRAKSANGGNLADASAGHISLIGEAYTAHVIDEIGGEPKGDMPIKIEFTPLDNLSDAVLVINTATAIA